MKPTEKALITPGYLPFFWLLIGAVLFSTSTGLRNIPVAAWIAPIFIIRFFRSQKALKGSLIILPVMIISSTFAWWGCLPFEDQKNYLLWSFLTGILSGIIFSIPFIADRILSPRLKGIMSTLVYPVTFMTLLHLNSYRPDSGSFGALVCLQYGNLLLQQVASIAGYLGIGFLIMWFSSLANWCWEHEFKWIEIKKPVCLYAGILLFFLLYGGARVSFGYPERDTVRVAGITVPFEKITTEYFIDILENKKCPPIEKNIETLNRLTREAADAGAKIISWEEYAFGLNNRDEKRFIEECSILARNVKVYLAVAYGKFNDNERYENKAVIVNPSGVVETEYVKHHLIQGSESAYLKTGTGDLPVIKTPYGNIALVICHDIHFPYYIQQAGIKGADIMLNPSLDWKAVTPISGYWTVLTAIENGFSLFKSNGGGLSIAADYHGRVLSSMDYFTTNNRIMYADLPVKGVRTIYAYGGYLFGWLCVLGLCVCVVFAFIKQDR